MSRVDELQKKYPSLPRNYIVRWDAKVHALRDTGELDEFGVWTSVSTSGTYASLDVDITLKDWVDAKPGRQKPGYILRPGKFVHPENGLLVNWYQQISTKSDLEIRHEGNGKFALYQGDERVEEVLHQPAKVKPERLTSSGKPESNFLTRKGSNCFKIAAVRFCEYFPLGLACKFCNYNMTQEDAHSVGLDRSTTIDIEETVEAYKGFTAEARIIEGTFQMGGISKREQEARIHIDFVGKMALATSYKPNFKVTTQPVDRKNLQRLKDAGMECISYDMEMWDPELFEETVPGKAKYVGRDRYLEAFEEAADVLGPGNVSGLLVGGLSLIPDNGHKTWQESRDSTVEGYEWLIRRGILPTSTPLWLPPGSAYASEENRKKCPPTDYYLELAIAHHELCKKYGLYHKLNRLLCCPLDRIGAILGAAELGAYEVAGSLGNWSAAVLPRELNWHLDWEERRKSMAATRQEV